MNERTRDNRDQMEEAWLGTSVPGVAARYVSVAGLPKLAGLIIYGEITSERLRSIPVRELEDVPPIASRYPDAEEQGRPPTAEEVEQSEGLNSNARRMADLHATKEMLTRGAGEPMEDFLQRVASAYYWLAKVSRKPSDDIARIAGVKPSTGAGWVYQARKAGLLPATTQGRRTR